MKRIKMFSKRGLLITIALLLLLSLVTACAAPEPTPTPTPTPAPAPTPTPAEHEIVEIRLNAGPFGGPAYILGFGLSDIVNKYHPWLRISARETFGSIDKIKLMDTFSPQERKMTIFSANDNVLAAAMEGMAPYFEKKHGNLKVVVLNNAFGTEDGGGGQFWYSTNADIKTKEDLIGKKVACGTRGSGKFFNASEMLTAMGILDKVEIQYISMGAAKNAIVDGLIDGSYSYASFAKGKSSPMGQIQEIMATRSVYFVGLTKEELDRYAKETGRAQPYNEIPAGAFGPNSPRNALGTLNLTTSYFCSSDADPEIIYELVKTVYQYRDKFKEYYTAGAQLENPRMLAYFPWTEDMVHPGALKFYKEKGIKIGID